MKFVWLFVFGKTKRRIKRSNKQTDNRAIKQTYKWVSEKMVTDTVNDVWRKKEEKTMRNSTIGIKIYPDLTLRSIKLDWHKHGKQFMVRRAMNLKKQCQKSCKKDAVGLHNAMTQPFRTSQNWIKSPNLTYCKLAYHGTTFNDVAQFNFAWDNITSCGKV